MRSMATSSTLPIAVFVTPHGFGHAARATAVMDALRRRDDGYFFEIFTTIPGWFFEDSLGETFRRHEVITDIGMVQRDPFHEDAAATLTRLDDFLPFPAALVADLAATLRRLHCRLVLCDIAPLGIAVAQAAGLPAVLVENFTWDWVYRSYVNAHPGFARHGDYLARLFRQADLHIQTEPVCRRRRNRPCTGPASRPPRNPAAVTRQRLGIPPDRRLVVITGGGILWPPTIALHADTVPDYIHLLVCGGDESTPAPPNFTLLPHRSPVYHPDIMAAADAVIGKVGYSTLAEVYHAGTPFGYLPRPHFIESRPLVRFIRRHMAGLPFTRADFAGDTWIEKIRRLLQVPVPPPAGTNGAVEIAARIHSFLLEYDR
ncbi:MAG: hypothetical protein JXQ27_03225 [Acidobacteria bacterium]|nr:hypothetical protein [Acidobacteriota bacterium]